MQDCGTDCKIERGNTMKQEDSKIRASVCLACYNGALYIQEQLASILPQMQDADELIIINDNSTDATTEILQNISDPRVHVYRNDPNLGVNRSFEKAIGLAKGRYILMADQDDIWTPGRLEKMVSYLQSKNVLLVSGNSTCIDKSGQDIAFDLGKLFEADSTAYGKNVLRIFTGKAYYFGCCMAFSAELKGIVLPFPKDVESHDLWIAMAANMMHSNLHLEDIVLKRRIHGKNASVIQRDLMSKIRSRIVFARSYMELKKRIRILK